MAKKLENSRTGMTRVPSSNSTSIYGNDFFEVVRRNGEVPVKEGGSSPSTSSTMTTKKTPSALIANSSAINPLLCKQENNNNNKHEAAALQFSHTSLHNSLSFKKPRIASSSNHQEFSAGKPMMNFSTFLRPSMLLANNCESNNKEEPFSQNQCKSVDHNSNSNNNNNKRKVVDTGFCDDPLIEYSSVCSLGASNNTDIISSRKQEVDDSIYLSENNDEDMEEDVMMKEIKNSRREGNNNGVRKSKKAETHNLYERQRRDKINKKLRILKDLIPNCNKVDKASLLDDAIEYLKALKLHLQIMTMGTGLCMSPLMPPTSCPQHLMNTNQLQHLMGFRHGINVPLCNMPHQFASIPPIPLPPATVGITNNNNGVGMFGFPNQFLPMMTPNNHPMSHHAPPFTTTTIHPMVGNNNNNNNNNIFTQTPLQTATNNISAPQ